MFLCGTFQTAPEQRHGPTPIVSNYSVSGPGPCTGIRHSRCDFTIILSKVLNSGLINSKRRSHARPSPPFRPPPTHHIQLYNAVVTRCACQRCASSYRDSRECRLSSYRLMIFNQIYTVHRLESNKSLKLKQKFGGIQSFPWGH